MKILLMLGKSKLFVRISLNQEKKEINAILTQVQVPFSIQWKWAFRYLWILKKD